MNYDKTMSDGRVITAPSVTYRVLESVPIVFQLAEWVLVIVAFQFVDSKYGYLSAKIVWIALAAALSCYLGILASNVAWRVIDDPFSNRLGRIFMYVILPAISGSFGFFLLKVVVKQMVDAQVSGA